MRRPAIQCLIVLFVFSVANILLAQNKPPVHATAAPTASQTPVSEAEQAFRDALKIKQPEERLRAFQRIRTMYPEYAAKNDAVTFNIFISSCQLSTPLVADARQTAEQWLAKTSTRGPDALAWDAFLLANHFYRAALWTDAEKYARTALATWDQRPSAQPAVQFGQSLRRVAVVALLGGSLFEQGRPAEARQTLEDAYHGRTDEPGVVGEVVPKLVDLARKDNRNADEADYLATLALYGGLTPDNRKALEAAWSAAHGGPSDGLEEMLDKRYEEEFPAMIPAGTWKRPDSAPGRTVLLEGFSGTSCAACVGVDLALDAVLRRYSRDDVILLTYHGHIPGPDPLVNSSSEQRISRYGIDGLPALAIDGTLPKEQGGGRAAEAGTIFKEQLQPALEQRLAAAPLARLQLKASVSAGIVRAAVNVSAVKPGEKNVRLHLALVEQRVRFSGTNGVRFHPMVVRKLANNGEGFPVAAATASIQATFDVAAVTRENKQYLDAFEKNNKVFGPITFAEKKHVMDAGNLAVVAFLQDSGTNEVLQAAWARIQ